MVLHPECQKRAHQEIDSAVGSERLPEFSDRESLPYIDCILQETLRFVSEHAYIARYPIIFLIVDGTRQYH